MDNEIAGYKRQIENLTRDKIDLVAKLHTAMGEIHKLRIENEELREQVQTFRLT